MVFEPTSHAGPLVAALLGVPAVRHIHGVDMTYQARDIAPEVLAPTAARLGPVPDGVRAVTGVALHQLPPTCSALIHQGGFGSTLTGARRGAVDRRVCDAGLTGPVPAEHLPR